MNKEAGFPTNSRPEIHESIPPTPEEIAAAVGVLQRLEPGILPLGVFMEITRLSTTAIAEIVPLRRGPSGTEILLLSRPDDDPTWPGMLHTPGTVIRPTDAQEGLETPWKRILNKELGLEPGGDSQIPRPREVGFFLHEVKRGTEFAHVSYIDLSNNPPLTQGTWYPVSGLPSLNVVDTQLKFIEASVHAFENPRQQ